MPRKTYQNGKNIIKDKFEIDQKYLSTKAKYETY